MRQALEISTLWDAEVGVWVAESKDVPGLVAGSRTVLELVKKLQYLIPVLLDAQFRGETPC